MDAPFGSIELEGEPSVAEWIRSAVPRLRDSGVEAAQLEASLLLAHLFRVDRVRLIAHPEWRVPSIAAEALLQRRLGHEPLAYILGVREFFGHSFEVGPGVLIPRHETEILVEACLDVGDDSGATGLRVLDVGTGSGCIAISIAIARPQWSVTGVDLSDDALRIASRNAERLAPSVQLQRSDLFANADGRWNLIVSNPPYIDRAETLPEEVGNWEPSEALFAEDGGLAIYKRLIGEAPQHLAPGGALLVEVGHTQAERVVDLFRDAGFDDVGTQRDLSGIERVVYGRSSRG